MVSQDTYLPQKPTAHTVQTIRNLFPHHVTQAAELTPTFTAEL